MTIFIANEAQKRSFNPGIVSRGYGRKSVGLQIVHDGLTERLDVKDAGDEPYFIAKCLNNIPVIVSNNRLEGAQRLIDDYNVDLVILDDAFQHRRIHRDTDIVLINGSEQNNAYRMIPLGHLREMPSELKRADHVIITKGDIYDVPNNIQKYLSNVTSSKEQYQIQYYNNYTDNKEKLNDKPLEPMFAFCGIAHPELFYDSLRGLGIQLEGQSSFIDHVDYSPKIISDLINKIEATNSKNIITTDKDLVKLSDDFLKKFNVYILSMEINIDKASLDSIFNF